MAWARLTPIRWSSPSARCGVNFHSFARLFRDHLDCPNALFLDGSISSLYAAELARSDGFFDLGPIVALAKRVSALAALAFPPDFVLWGAGHDHASENRRTRRRAIFRTIPRPSLIGMTREALADAHGAAGVPEKQRRMRAGQIWHWIYHRGVQSFAEMTNIAKELRQRLAEDFVIGRPEIVTEQVSTDGTRKWLLRLAPDERGARHEVEMVYIPEEDRGTLCISTQVGCTLTCTFCHTGTQKLVRNLTAGEIVGQVMLARDRVKDWPHDIEANPTPPWAGATSPMSC